MSQTARPISTIDPDSWGTESEGADLHNSIDEVVADDNTTFIATTVDSTCKVQLASLSEPGSREDHTVTFRAKGSSGVGEALAVKLLDGGVEVTSVNPEILLTTSWTTYTFTLTESEAEAITDYTDLGLSFNSGGNIGEGPVVSVTQAFLTIPDAAVATEEDSMLLLGVS